MMMKYFVAVLCLAQIVLSAPAEPTIFDQAQQTIASIQEQATAAVTDLNSRFLEATGVKSNEALLTSVQQQGQTYANQIQGTIAKINEQLGAQRTQADSMFASIAQQISASAASLLGNNDPTKVDQIQKTFDNVLQQTNALNSQLQQQGTAAQEALKETVGKLYEQTLASAKNVATQLDARKP